MKEEEGKPANHSSNIVIHCISFERFNQQMCQLYIINSILNLIDCCAHSFIHSSIGSSPDTQLPYHNQYGRPLQPSPSDFYFMTGRSFPSLSSINTSAVMNGLSELFETVMKAIDNVDKKYN